ncbi:unnamed protein product [Pleuronectes platessa]|uniref:Uncharacterized protein n=1 Tax=Pleuronectes platessa TaxID=8262 RepID=A0A9N7TN88_PLEPL|nr:unnamed protein product [Pleuronectes platessa]
MPLLWTFQLSQGHAHHETSSHQESQEFLPTCCLVYRKEVEEVIGSSCFLGARRLSSFLPSSLRVEAQSERQPVPVSFCPLRPPPRIKAMFCRPTPQVRLASCPEESQLALFHGRNAKTGTTTTTIVSVLMCNPCGVTASSRGPATLWIGSVMSKKRKLDIERFEKGKTVLGLCLALEVIEELECLNTSLQKRTETVAVLTRPWQRKPGVLLSDWGAPLGRGQQTTNERTPLLRPGGLWGVPAH